MNVESLKRYKRRINGLNGKHVKTVDMLAGDSKHSLKRAKRGVMRGSMMCALDAAGRYRDKNVGDTSQMWLDHAVESDAIASVSLKTAIKQCWRWMCAA